MGDKVERARVLRAEIESMAQGLDDTAAEAVPEFFPEWNPAGCDYKTGDRVRYAGILYKVLQPHTSQAGWTPEAAAALFAQVLAGQDGTEIGEWTQPESTNPYNTGDRVMFNGKMYESVMDNNIWSPEAYPQGWQEITQE